MKNADDQSAQKERETWHLYRWQSKSKHSTSLRVCLRSTERQRSTRLSLSWKRPSQASMERTANLYTIWKTRAASYSLYGMIWRCPLLGLWLKRDLRLLRDSTSPRFTAEISPRCLREDSASSTNVTSTSQAPTVRCFQTQKSFPSCAKSWQS